jgi:NADPH:quinone reductase-like Zn-dependent oxidoreductase
VPSNIPATMRAVLLTGHGGMDKLVYRTNVPVPRPAPGEVLIEVSACGMNNTDVWVRLGAYGTDEDPDAGERVLITGASGGVGSGLIQLCRARRAIPYAVVGPGKERAVLEIGAEAAITRGAKWDSVGAQRYSRPT